jgi:hypothetical protein
MDCPRGLRPYGEVKRITYYKKAVGYASALFDGTPVILTTAGYLNQAGAGSEKIIGVCAKYSAASTADEVPVYDHPDQLFTVQDDASATLTQAAVGASADLLAESGNTTTGLSTVEINASAVSADHTSATVRIIEVANRIYPDGVVNAVGAWCEWLVRINEHAYAQVAGGI